MTGTVSTWDDVKGFGFVHPDHPGPDAFVHHKFISSDGRNGKRKSLWPGQRVFFEAVQGAIGLEARNVVVLEVVKSKS